MARILHSVLVQERAVAADAVEVWDLAVNPLSVILLCIRPLNDTGTLNNFQRYMGLCTAFNSVKVLYRGQSVLSMRGDDIAAYNYMRHGIIPREGNPSDTDNERRCVVLPIILGKYAYDSESCFPATRRGELSLELDIDVADTGYDNFRYSVETIELLGATPAEFERKVAISQTFAVTGDQSVALPVGNLIRGVMLFGTSGFTGAAPAPTWGRFGLYLDNQQVAFSASDFETSLMLSQLNGRIPPYGIDGHMHRLDATAAVTTQPTFTSGPFEVGDGSASLGSPMGNYTYLDLDPSRDDEFSIDTAGAQNFQIRPNVETADAARILPVERVLTGAVAGLPGAA